MKRLRRGTSVLVAFCVLILATKAYAEAWYLLAPPWRNPIKENEEEFDTTAQLVRWEQMAGFDNARTCEQTRLALINKIEKEHRRDKGAG